MSRVLTLNKGAASLNRARMQRTSTTIGSVFAASAKASRAGGAPIKLISLIFVLVVGACVCGAGYLYQVNDIATKGYEIRDLEARIKDLNDQSKKMEINEVELRSMYNIEKASQDLNLVKSADVTYVEINGPVAMK